MRAMYLYSAMADLARHYGAEGLYSACERLWENMVCKKMYITGGIGATHFGEAFSHSYDLPNDTAYAETCASIGLIFWTRRMLQIKPDSNYADVMELALYNTVLSGMALDGKWISLYQEKMDGRRVGLSSTAWKRQTMERDCIF